MGTALWWALIISYSLQGIGCTKITKVRNEGSANGTSESRSYLEKKLVFCFGSYIAARMLLPFGEENFLSSSELNQAQEVVSCRALWFCNILFLSSKVNFFCKWEKPNRTHSFLFGCYRLPQEWWFSMAGGLMIVLQFTIIAMRYCHFFKPKSYSYTISGFIVLESLLRVSIFVEHLQSVIHITPSATTLAFLIHTIILTYLLLRKVTATCSILFALNRLLLRWYIILFKLHGSTLSRISLCRKKILFLDELNIWWAHHFEFNLSNVGRWTCWEEFSP